MEIVLESLDWFEGEEAGRRSAMIGEQLALAFTVDDCQATYETLHEHGVEFISEPTEQPYGIEAIATDLYGNGIVLVEHPSEAKVR